MRYWAEIRSDNFVEAGTLSMPLPKGDLISINNLGNQTSLVVVQKSDPSLSLLIKNQDCLPETSVKKNFNSIHQWRKLYLKQYKIFGYQSDTNYNKAHERICL